MAGKTLGRTLGPVPATAQRRGLSVLGSTGSVGLNTLKVAGLHPERYRVVALAGLQDVERMFGQCVEYQPDMAALHDEAAAEKLAERVRHAGLPIQVLGGQAGVTAAAVAKGADIVMASIVGSAGLVPTLAAVQAGRRVLLANKEPLVMAGRLMLDEAARSGAELLPIDSEHNAVFQCLPPVRASLEEAGVRRILLTCSGGPFLRRTASLEAVTPNEACAHPNWQMGRKISVDSATLMNKGLEVIEACHLFGALPDQVDVVVHPQSVIHSLVEYRDGSVLAQLGAPDMRTPIAHALAWPDRIASGVDILDLVRVGQLSFEAPDRTRFPCLALAYQAMRRGGTAPVVLNAANEVAVAEFLKGRLRFVDIPVVIEETLGRTSIQDSRLTLPLVLAEDEQSRQIAREQVALLRMNA